MQYFLAVAHAGSVSGAAQRLHVAASAVSRQVSKLEDAIGGELFQRRQRGMRLTEAGERLAMHLAGVSAEGERVLNRVKSLPPGDGLIVRLACTDGFANGLLPPVIERFRAANTGAQVHLSVVSPEDASRMLQQHHVDLALKYSVAPERRANSLYSELAPTCALMRPDHPLARRRSLTLAEVVRHPLVIAAEGMT
ncbi:MAG: LysR family transcriptional regulator, partial [Burkholderiales bacterium]